MKLVEIPCFKNKRNDAYENADVHGKFCEKPPPTKKYTDNENAVTFTIIQLTRPKNF